MAGYVVIHQLVKTYGDFYAVDNLNLEVEQGEIFGLLGPNSMRIYFKKFPCKNNSISHSNCFFRGSRVRKRGH